MHPRAGACLFRPRSQPCQRSPRRPRVAGGNFLSRGSFKRRLCHIRRCRLTPHGREFPARLPAPPSLPVTAGERRGGGARERAPPWGPRGPVAAGESPGFLPGEGPTLRARRQLSAARPRASPRPPGRSRASGTGQRSRRLRRPAFSLNRVEKRFKKKEKKKYLCKVPPSAGAAAGFYQEEGERGPHFILFSYLVAPFDGNVICVISRAHTGD